MKPHTPETLESLLGELFAHLDGSKARVMELHACVPTPYFMLTGRVVDTADKETRHIVERLAEELHRQGLTRTATPPPLAHGKDCYD